jgi:GTP-binding protein HflX
VLAENKLFATLDPAHRRLRFPHPENPQIDRNHPVILTDTVGFIRDLPDDLVSAFKATLEVLHEAAIFVHVLDASDPEIHQRLESVEKIVAELGIEKVPTLLALNKADLVTAELLDGLEEGFRTDGKYAATIRTSALKSEGLDQLLSEIERVLF